jgi:hypothetical protein
MLGFRIWVLSLLNLLPPEILRHGNYFCNTIRRHITSNSEQFAKTSQNSMFNNLLYRRILELFLLLFRFACHMPFPIYRNFHAFRI